MGVKYDPAGSGTTITLGSPANGLDLTADVLTLGAADGTHNGAITTGTQTIAGAKTFSGAITASNLSGTNSGNTTLAAIGSSANANGATLTGQALNLEPASASFGGIVTTGTQSIAGAKTFTGAITASNLTNTNSGDVTLAAIGASANANGASLSAQALTLQPASASFGGVLTSGVQDIAGAKTFKTSASINGSLTLDSNLQIGGAVLQTGGDSGLYIRGNMNAGSTSAADVQLRSNATRSAGNIVEVINNSTTKAYTRYDGLQAAPDFFFTAADASIAVTATGATATSCGVMPHIFLLTMTVPYTSYIENASAAHVPLFTLPARARILRAYADTTIPYTVAAGTIKLSVGAAGDGDTTILLQKDVKTAAMFQGGSKAASNAADLGTPMLNGGGFMWINTSNQPATNVINAVIATGTGNCGNGATTNLTAGSTSFSFVIEILP